MVYGLTRLKRIKVSSVVYFLDLPRFNKNFKSFKVNRAVCTRNGAYLRSLDLKPGTYAIPSTDISTASKYMQFKNTCTIDPRLARIVARAYLSGTQEH